MAVHSLVVADLRSHKYVPLSSCLKLYVLLMQGVSWCGCTRRLPCVDGVNFSNRYIIILMMPKPLPSNEKLPA